MTLHLRKVLLVISFLFCRRHCTIWREVVSSEEENEVARHIKSEAELVDVIDTLKRVSFERMRVEYPFCVSSKDKKVQ